MEIYIYNLHIICFLDLLRRMMSAAHAVIFFKLVYPQKNKTL